MDLYEISWKASAVKELRSIAPQFIPKLIHSIEQLARNPFTGNVRKLQGSTNSYRMRVGDYRVLYVVFEERKTLEISRVRHRKDVYR